MTKVKICGLRSLADIEKVNRYLPDYIGFVFADSRRFVTDEQALEMSRALDRRIQAVGVFVNESPETVAYLLDGGIIDIAQLHGAEDEKYIEELRELTEKPIIKAFRIASEKDVSEAEKSGADYILLDSGAGTGTVFDWSLLRNIKRPYFLAGGLSPENAEAAIAVLKPYAADVSSSIETHGFKDKIKMTAFVNAVRKGR